MKKITLFIAAIAMLGTNAAFAAQTNNTGKGAAQSSSSTYDDMSWLVGLGTLGVVATVVGITAASASSEPSSYSH